VKQREKGSFGGAFMVEWLWKMESYGCVFVGVVAAGIFGYFGVHLVSFIG